MRYSITWNLRIYQRIVKTMFPTVKNGILNPLGILRILQNFWLFDPECLYKISDVLSQQTTCEMKALQVQAYIQQWFHDEQGAKFM